ncbi:DUF1287 domain-containing protein [Pseudodesulfovibrio sp. zrk46]|uniref:DUF1287 domain-containing protein n=1 Tax=Pseudodesulfovibrio sp. zrk46 TaxID=2725288 RepID=UPI00144A085C|nr:DUF1287 domain-containing protein [Pseudodesulfovibrio sp. zrk46]QJB56170.1 DUF1287 domain-containing protein [Pseudodesulfovibrio sp. zrk46]
MLRSIIKTYALAALVTGWLLLLPVMSRAESGPCYAASPVINLRSGPDTHHALVGQISGNDSLFCLEKRGAWFRAVRPDGVQGWVRSDLLSKIVVSIDNKKRELQVFNGKSLSLTASVRQPNAHKMGGGRYFARKQGNRLEFDWPNRHDMRNLLAKGQMTYPVYVQSLRRDVDAHGNRLALCSAGDKSKSCVITMPAGKFRKLMESVSDYVRVEFYSDNEEKVRINSPDDLSRRVHMGAWAQLESPAAGLGPSSRVPHLSYPGGDIQPDFATSADIVVRAVRKGGVDLQALVHEDMVLAPEAYSGLEAGPDGAGAHRRIPVLFNWFKRHTLSLPVSVTEDPFAFEGGDIVFFGTTSSDGTIVPDHAGVVCEAFNRAGYPMVITVWDMGWLTRKMDLLGKANPKVVGHFRMLHLFDYQ